MAIVVRPLDSEDAARFLDIHHQAIRGLAAKDYSPAVIDAWAPLPITREMLTRFNTNRDDEIRLIASVDDVAVGIGALVGRLVTHGFRCVTATGVTGTSRPDAQRDVGRRYNDSQ